MNRLIHLRLVVAITITTAIALGFFANRVSAAEPTRTQATGVTATSEDVIPVLPTVTVSAKAEIPVLPVIVVTPSEDQRHEALAMNTPLLASVSKVETSTFTHNLIPHMRLDMPYYSFGKMMPRAIKE